MLLFIFLVVNIAKSKELEYINTDYNRISAPIISPNNYFKAYLFGNNYIIIRKLPSDTIYDICALFKHSGDQLSIRFLSDSIILVNNFTDSLKKYIYKYNIHSKKVTDTITILDRSMTVDDTRFYFSKNSKSLYVLRTFAYIDKYDMETGKLVGELVNPTPWDHIWQFAVSDDEQSFAYAFNDALQILDKDGRLIRQFDSLKHFNLQIFLPGNGASLITYFASYSSIHCYSIIDTTINFEISGQYEQIYMDTCIYIIYGYELYNNKIKKLNIQTYSLDSIDLPIQFSIQFCYIDDHNLKTFIDDSGYYCIYNITQKKIESKYLYGEIKGILSDNSLIVINDYGTYQDNLRIFSYEIPNFKIKQLKDLLFTSEYPYSSSNKLCLMPCSDILTYPIYNAKDSTSKIMTYNIHTGETIEEGSIKDSVNFAYFTKNKEYLYYSSEKTFIHYIKWETKEDVMEDTHLLHFDTDLSTTGRYYKTYDKIINSETKQSLFTFSKFNPHCKWADNDKYFILQNTNNGLFEYGYTIYDMVTLDSLYCLTTDPIHGKFLSISSPVFEIIHDRYLLLEYEDSTYLLFDIVNLRKVEEFTYPHGIVQISGFTSDLVYCYGYCDGFFTVWRTGLPNAVVEHPETKTTSIISVSPNPAADYVSLNVASGGRLLLKLYNFGGNFVMDYANDYYSYGEGFRLDVSALPQGIYYIKAYIDNEFLGEEKFVIVR